MRPIVRHFCRKKGDRFIFLPVHLLLEPGETPEALGQLMKQVAARQTRYVNRLEGRTGTLWEGRYKLSSVESERYVLACCR